MLYAAVNKEEIAKLIGPVDMAKLKDQDVLFLLQENPKEEMFKAYFTSDSDDVFSITPNEGILPSNI